MSPSGHFSVDHGDFGQKCPHRGIFHWVLRIRSRLYKDVNLGSAWLYKGR